MSTITAVLEPDADGTLHLPLPPGWRAGAVRVRAELEPVAEAQELPDADQPARTPRPGCLRGFWMSKDFDAPLDDFKEYQE